MALDLVIRGGRVITPEGAHVRDVGVAGERIASVALPGSLPVDGARVLDAGGQIVAPGGVEPHTHLAHAIRMRPEEPGLTLGPEDDTRGMAAGGTTTHIDFCFVRPGSTIARTIEERSARWAGRSLVDYAFHVTLCGALPPATFDEMPEAIQAGFPSFKVFTTDVLPPHPKRPPFRLDLGRIQRAMGQAARHGGLLIVHGEDDELVQWNYLTFRETGRLDASNMHLVHTKLSEQLAFQRVLGVARGAEAAVYFVHVSALEGLAEVTAARDRGRPVYAETLHQYACFDADYYRAPRGICAHTYPSLKLAEDRAALWDGLVRGGVSTLATDEYPTTLAEKLRGRTIEDVTGGNLGAEARLGICFTEGVVKRGMTLERFADVTATNAARIFGLYPRKGVIAPGSDADLVLLDPSIRKTLTRDDFHVADYSPWEGWDIAGWPALTLLRGRVIADRGRILGQPGDGRLLTRRIDGAVLTRPVC